MFNPLQLLLMLVMLVALIYGWVMQDSEMFSASVLILIINWIVMYYQYKKFRERV